LGTFQAQARLEALPCVEQGLQVGGRLRAQHHLVADAAHMNLGPLETKLLGQTHGLTAAVAEQFGDAHDLLQKLDARKHAYRSYFCSVHRRHFEPLERQAFINRVVARVVETVQEVWG
jgi:hypothetical protein